MFCSFMPQLFSDNVSLQQYSIPYKSAHSFAAAASSGRARFSLVNNTMPFYEAKNDTFWFGNMISPIQTSPSNLLLHSSWQEACAEYMAYDSDTFTLQYDGQVMFTCSSGIVKQLQASCFDDAPVEYISFLFYSNSPYIENVSRLTEILLVAELRHFFLKQIMFAKVAPATYAHTGIAIESLRLLFLLHMALLAICGFVCLLEIFIAKRTLQRH